MSRQNAPIDSAVDRLAAAYRHAGLPPLRAPDRVDAVIEEIHAEIAPLRLPEELERFWRLVDPESVTVAPYPHPMSVAFALRSWRMHRDEAPGMAPRALFPFAYESHGFLSIELEDGRGNGGTVLEWGYGDEAFRVRFPALSAYLDLLATMIESDELVRHDGSLGRVEFDPERRWPGAQAVRLASIGALPGLGLEREIPQDVRAWPEHWLLPEGLAADARTPRGATTTVAALLRDAAAGGAAGGTIRARVSRLVGSADGRRVAVADGSGVLDVWCPTVVCTYGPIVEREFEFDVVVRPAPPAPPDWAPEHREIQQKALDHDLIGAQDAVARLYSMAFETPAAAEATAVRPVE